MLAHPTRPGPPPSIEATAKVAVSLALGKATCKVQGKEGWQNDHLREMVLEYLDACTTKKDEPALNWILARAAIALSLIGVQNDTILRRVEDALPPRREG